jgi:hypothetical protein
VKALLRRICRLEENVASSNFSGPSWVDVLFERQRRRREASGLPPEHLPLEPLLDERGRPRTWAAVLSSCQARRCAESQRAQEAARVAELEQAAESTKAGGK